MATKRLRKELEQYAKSPSPAIPRLEPVDDDLFNLTAVLRGPEGTAYEGKSFANHPKNTTIPSANSFLPGGLFTLSLSLPPTYPNLPPTITFKTPCCHANVSFSTGEICLDLLTPTSWTPAYGLVTALEAVQLLLASGGEVDSPLNLDLARLIRDGDGVGAEALVRFYTGVWARGD